MQLSTTLSRQAPIERIRKAFLLVTGALLTLVGTAAAISDLSGYWTGSGPLGIHLFNAPYAVGFFEVHGLMAFFGILLLTLGRRDPNPGWHLAVAAFFLFSAVGIAIFWQGAVEWNVASAEAAVAVLDVILVAVHLLLYALARRTVRQ